MHNSAGKSKREAGKPPENAQFSNSKTEAAKVTQNPGQLVSTEYLYPMQ